MALAGGIVTVIGLFVIGGQHITEPKKELQQKIQNLEEEIHILKNQK